MPFWRRWHLIRSSPPVADAGRMSALESENQTLKAQVSELSDTVRQLAERLKEQPKRGRPRKEDVFDVEDEAA